jgi:hypothetical protein
MRTPPLAPGERSVFASDPGGRVQHRRELGV